MPPRSPGRSLQDVERMNLQSREMQQQREIGMAAQLDARRRSMLESGPMLEHGANDNECPVCGVGRFGGTPDWKPEKVHCGGRDPHAAAGVHAMCVILGDHLHARCPACSWSWFERVKTDEAKLPGRGALRYDEALVGSDGFATGELVQLDPLPTLESVWGYVEPEVKTP